MELKYTIKNVYGKELVYPACDKSKLFAQLLKVKSFNSDQLVIIANLGYNWTAGASKTI